MNRTLSALCLLTLSLIAPLSHAQTPPTPPSPEIKTAFAKAVEFLKEKKYAEALVPLKQVLAAQPDDLSVLWNAGMAAFFSKDYAYAKKCYTRMNQLDPVDGMVLTRLIQVAQAQGNLPERDRQRTALLELVKSQKEASGLDKRPTFCRDQFFAGSKLVLAYERFQFVPRKDEGDGSGSFAVRYEFFVTGPDDKTEQRIEVGWNSVKKTPKGTWVSSGEISAFYFDAYPKEGPMARITYGLFLEELSYDACRSLVLKALDGKIKPVSGAARPPK
jgi:tetratricopeptide (TPR) repeat protein